MVKGYAWAMATGRGMEKPSTCKLTPVPRQIDPAPPAVSVPSRIPTRTRRRITGRCARGRRAAAATSSIETSKSCLGNACTSMRPCLAKL
jgi:hypothetical protein